MRISMIAFTNIEYTVELTEGLSELEDVMLMIPDKQAERFKDVIKPDVNLYAFSYPRIRHFTNVIMVYKIIQKINSFKPHIIHIQKGHPWLNYVLRFLRKKYCLITTIHDVILLDWPSKRIPEFTYAPPIKYADQLIVHGDFLKRAMVAKYKRASEDIHVLPRGVNSIYTRYIKVPVEEDSKTVMYFGRIWGYKGLRYLIEAEPLITAKFPDARIIIAGSGENFQKYEKAMVNKDKFIVYNEFISQQMVAELFQRTAVVVLPYIDGSQSGVIPQAYAFKKPVVITNVGSLPENVDHGHTGYIVPPRNSEKLAEAIIDLLQNEDRRKEMGQNAFRKTQAELAWRNIAPRTIEVYKRALAKRKLSYST